jgi:hypothetical protein
VKALPTRTDVGAKYRIGTSADTPASLRRKSAEILRMAGETHDIDLSEELRLVATLYMERAAELEKPGRVAPGRPSPTDRDS